MSSQLVSLVLCFFVGTGEFVSLAFSSRSLNGRFIAGLAIDCFKCVSINGDRSECDDPFHNNHSTALLETPCMGGRKGRDGVFPATACVKISGYYGMHTHLDCGWALCLPILSMDVFVYRRHRRNNHGAGLCFGQWHFDHGHGANSYVALWTVLLR